MCKIKSVVKNITVKLSIRKYLTLNNYINIVDNEIFSTSICTFNDFKYL